MEAVVKDEVLAPEILDTTCGAIPLAAAPAIACYSAGRHLERVYDLCASAVVFERLWLQAVRRRDEKRSDISWYREYFRAVG